MSQSKLKSFAPVMNNGTHSSYVTANGTFYNFTVEMENGDSGQCSSSKTEPSWRIGEEYTYEVVVNGNYTNIKKMKPVNTAFGGGGKYDSTGARVGMAINKSCDMFIAGKFDDMHKIESTARWLIQMAEKLEAEFKK